MFSIDIFSLASIIGTIAFALSGFMVGVRKDLDIMGIFILAMLTANGGGAVRDVLVGRLPNVLTDIYAFLIVVAVMIAAWLLKVHHSPASKKSIEKSHIFVVSDSLGLVAFSVTGTLVGIEAGLSIFGVMVLAFITATGGGIIRDLMVNDVPAVLNSDFYGTVSILLAGVMYGLHLTSYYNDTTLTILFVAALIIRLIAYHYGWKLPRIRKD